MSEKKRYRNRKKTPPINDDSIFAGEDVWAVKETRNVRVTFRNKKDSDDDFDLVDFLSNIE